MKKFLPLVLAFLITLVFFFQMLSGKIPFPGDLLVGHYKPYSTYSFLGYNPGAFPNKGQDFDVLTLLYPDKEFSIDSLKKGIIPLWDPYLFSGNPHFASLQSGAFYPLNFFFFVFPFVYSWAIFIFIQPVLALFFTYLFLRELKLSDKSAFFGGLVFAFSSYSVVWMEYGNIGHAILWLPLVLLSVRKLCKKNSILDYLILIFALSMSILAGHIQVTIYVFCFSFIFALFSIYTGDGQRSATSSFKILSAYVAAFLVCSVQMLPAIELFLNSARSAYTGSSFYNLLIPPYHLATLFVPDFFGNPATNNYWLNGTYIERVMYIGIVPLFFAASTFFAKKTKYFGFLL